VAVLLEPAGAATATTNVRMDCAPPSTLGTEDVLHPLASPERQRLQLTRMRSCSSSPGVLVGGAAHAMAVWVRQLPAAAVVGRDLTGNPIQSILTGNSIQSMRSYGGGVGELRGPTGNGEMPPSSAASPEALRRAVRHRNAGRLLGLLGRE
jgi:hypothetical protein